MIQEIIDELDQPAPNPQWLGPLGVSDLELAHRNLQSIANSGMTLDLVDSLLQQLRTHLPRTSDPNRALNNLERFITASRSALATGALFDRDPTGLPILLTLFSTSQYLSDLLITDTESYDALRLSEGQLHTREVMVDELVSEIETATDPTLAMTILRRFKNRETLRIAFGDLILGHRIEEVTEQISHVADATCTAALYWARRHLEKKWGTPLDDQEQPTAFVIMALGKLGGTELNYSSDIDLLMVYENDGRTSEGRSNREFFEKLTQQFTKLLSESTELGTVYRVDLRLRPDGRQGRVCNSLGGLLQYYDLKGRTWERQAWIKARPVAGNLALGQRLLDRQQPWIFRRNLRLAEISGIQVLKRQIERRARVDGQEDTNVKTGHGGIRDVEFVIQFLQLLNGHETPSVRTGNTLDAIQRLLEAGCLTMQEAMLLVKNYNWLRAVEHRLQIMFNLQNHTLPADREELKRLALRMGYVSFFGRSPIEQFDQQFAETTESNRKILDHILHRPFGENEDDREVAPIVDALLLHDPDEKIVDEAMAKYHFADQELAFRHAKALAVEKTMFLSQARCRHFLAAIADRLLSEIASTPSPDATLLALRRVSDSLGAKAVLWELFNSNQASLELYVRLCASSDYLASILISNPGMIDALIDSLMMETLPTYDWLRRHLAELARGAEDLDPIIHSYKHAQHLRIGVRDILRKDPIEATHRALSDVAEICVKTVCDEQFQKLASKHFSDLDPPFPSKQSGFVVLAMGKLGGREPNYHSDLDVVYLYDAVPELTARLKPEISCQFFFSQVAAATTKYLVTAGKYGRLYELDCRLRPTGKSGALAVSLAEFNRYFESGDGQLWERQALCKARPIFGSGELREHAMAAVRRAINTCPWRPAMANQIHKMRIAMQENCSPLNLKRGVGGTVDIEFGVQLLQLKSAGQYPEVLVPGTTDAIARLVEHGCLEPQEGKQIADGYRLLRNVEARLRLMNSAARHDLPNEPGELAKLAYLLGNTTPEELHKNVRQARDLNRIWFDQLIETEGVLQ